MKVAEKGDGARSACGEVEAEQGGRGVGPARRACAAQRQTQSEPPRPVARAREFGGNRDERTSRDEDAEQGSRREQRPTSSAGLDAFAPVLEAWKQIFKSWSELTETMVKVQQDAFASMIGAADTTAKNIKDIKVGDRHNDELAFSRSRSTASRTTASTPNRIEHDRR